MNSKITQEIDNDYDQLSTWKRLQIRIDSVAISINRKLCLNTPMKANVYSCVLNATSFAVMMGLLTFRRRLIFSLFKLVGTLIPDSEYMLKHLTLHTGAAFSGRLFSMLPFIWKNSYSIVGCYDVLTSCKAIYDRGFWLRVDETAWDHRRRVDGDWCKEIDSFKTTVVGCPDKKDFRAVVAVNRYRHPAGHPHPYSRAERDVMAALIDQFIETKGYTVYSLSQDKLHNSGDGERLHYSIRDLTLQLKTDPVTSNHIISIVDADYYQDMPAVLSLARPIVMYTYVADHVGKSDAEGVYTVSDDKVRQHIAGGGDYIHPLWDYNHDFISARTPSTGFSEQLVVYSVEQLRMDDSGHRLIYLCPTVKYDAPAMVLDRIPSNQLKRQKLSKEGINYLSHFVEGVLCYSLSTAGDPYCVTIKATQFWSIWNRWSINHRINPSDIGRIMGSDESVDASAILAKLFSMKNDNGAFILDPTMLKDNQGVGNTAKIISVEPTPMAIHFNSADDDTSDLKKYARTFMNPMITKEGVFPCDSLGNQKLCIKGRITDVANKVVPPSIYVRYAQEFVRMTVPTPHVGSPQLVDEVMETQNRPTQRRRTEQIIHMLDVAYRFVVRAFQKAECYPAPGFPRNISQVPTEYTVNFSTITYAFKNAVLKKHGWYTPCRTPSEIAESVFDMAQRSPFLTGTDYEKFDGSFPSWIRWNVVNACYLRYFSTDHKRLVSEQLELKSNAPGFTQAGVKYNTSDTTLSGSPDTTDGNCMGNAFASYCANRLSGMTPEEAYANIGLVYGDDNLTKLEKQYVLRANADLGFKVKVDVYEKNNPVEYLGRTYPDPWITKTSFQCIARTLSKMHTTIAPINIPIGVAAVNKVNGYLITDQFTPIISNVAKLVKVAYEHEDLYDGLSAQQLSELDKDLPYYAQARNECNGAWPQDAGDYDLMVSVIAKQLGLDCVTVEQYCDYLDEKARAVDYIEALASLRSLLPIDGDYVEIRNKLNEDLIVDLGAGWEKMDKVVQKPSLPINSPLKPPLKRDLIKEAEEAYHQAFMAAEKATVNSKRDIATKTPISVKPQPKVPASHQEKPKPMPLIGKLRKVRKSRLKPIKKI